MLSSSFQTAESTSTKIRSRVFSLFSIITLLYYILQIIYFEQSLCSCVLFSLDVSEFESIHANFKS